VPHGPTNGVFIKRGPAGRLTREAELLRRACHPGVVQLVELRGQPDPVLVTRLVDGPSLAAGPTLQVDGVAGLVAALATTVADLHRLGLVHGSILPEHVLVASGGRPVLCGLADGGQSDDPLDHARDVGALGELLRWLLARAPQPQTASRRQRAGAIPALLALALRATSPDPRMRPSASTMAAGLRAAAPHATLPGQAVAREPEPRQWPRAPARAVVAAVAVSVTLLAVMRFGGSSPEQSSRLPAPRRAHASTSVGSACAAVDGPLRADVDGDGCPERLRFVGGVLDAGAVRWAIGGPADDIVSGDWNCDGRATLAFLDRGTGRVYRFDAWPLESMLTVPLIAQVDAATDLRVTHRVEPACDVLTVNRAAGPPRVLE
jgi:hypothetical protein